MIEAISNGIFSGGFQLRRGGQLVAELNPSAWREKAELATEGATYQLYREGALSGAFVLERDGQPVARAHKVSAFSDTFELQIGKRTFTLRKESVWRRKFVLDEGGEPVGTIAPKGTFSRNALIDFPDDWPGSIQGFVFWLALLMWKRAQAAAS